MFDRCLKVKLLLGWVSLCFELRWEFWSPMLFLNEKGWLRRSIIFVTACFFFFRGGLVVWCLVGMLKVL